MLAVGLKQAKEYDKRPILIAKCRNNPKHNLYYVKEGILPCQDCHTTSPLELLSKKEIFELKKRYKVSSRLLKKVEQCYSNSDTTVDLGSECKTLSGKIFVEELEKKILNRLKKEVRLDSANWLPHYDTQLVRLFNQHTFLCGPSGCGKSTLVTEIIEHCLPESTSWCFGPLISTDPVFKRLQKTMTKRKIKLVDSGKIQMPIDIQEIVPQKSGTTVLVIDDPDSMGAELKHIMPLCTQSLFHGRHLGILCLTISHDAFSRRVSSVKASSNECSRCILYPQIASHVCTKVMKNRLNMSQKVIKRIFDFLTKDDRWMCIFNHNPCCVLTSTGCLLL